MERVRTRLLVSGRVQGVFYRDTCRREAEARGVAGYATNLPDGRVEVVFEGPPDAVDEMVEWSRRGPRHAHVESVDVTDEPPEGDQSFEIT